VNAHNERKKKKRKKSRRCEHMLKTRQEHTNTSYKTKRDKEKNLFIYHRYNLANVSNSSSTADG